MSENADKVERLLSAILLQLMRGLNQGEKIRQLNQAGFSNLEIADALETNPAVVASTIYLLKKKPKKKRSSKKK